MHRGVGGIWLWILAQGKTGVGNMERYPLCNNGRLVSEMALVVVLLLLFMEWCSVLQLYDIAVRVECLAA